MKLNLIFLSSMITLCSCVNSQKTTIQNEEVSDTIQIDTVSYPDVIGNIPTPKGYVREEVQDSSWAHYLRNLPLKPEGTPVLLYNGEESGWTAYAYGVIDMEIGDEDLQQCADAVIRLRAEYLYQQKRYADIHFNFTNGFECNYRTYACGGRVNVKEGKYTNWYQAKQESDYSYKTFREYLDLVFMYAGTYSLSKELKEADINNIHVGDVFIQGGFPGHAMIVVDVAKCSATGGKAILVAQSYMPAQDIHIIASSKDNPWYLVDDFIKSDMVKFHSWKFTLNSLKTFK